MLFKPPLTLLEWTEANYPESVIKILVKYLVDTPHSPRLSRPTQQMRTGQHASLLHWCGCTECCVTPDRPVWKCWFWCLEIKEQTLLVKNQEKTEVPLSLNTRTLSDTSSRIKLQSNRNEWRQTHIGPGGKRDTAQRKCHYKFPPDDVVIFMPCAHIV